MNPSAERVWRFIAAYFTEHGYAPSLREIGDGCFMGRSTALYHLNFLAAKGFISVTPGIARGIAIKAYPPALPIIANEDIR